MAIRCDSEDDLIVQIFATSGSEFGTVKTNNSEINNDFRTELSRHVSATLEIGKSGKSTWRIRLL